MEIAPARDVKSRRELAIAWTQSAKFWAKCWLFFAGLQALCSWRLDSAAMLETAKSFAPFLALSFVGDWVCWRWPRPSNWLGDRILGVLQKMPVGETEAEHSRFAVALLALLGFWIPIFTSSSGWPTKLFALIASAFLARFFWLLMVWMDGLAVRSRKRK